MRVFIKTSSWAIWAARLARLVLPLYIVAIAAHHVDLIESGVFVIVFGLATVLGLVALGVGIIAFVRLWYTGDHGWGKASLANLVGLVAASIVILVTLLGAQYPATNQISTDIGDPPALAAPSLEAVAQESELKRMWEETSNSFPTAVTRTYPLGRELFQPLVQSEVENGNWFGTLRLQNSSEPSEILFVGDVKTWLGFNDRVAVRVRFREGESITDMRSVSYFGESDLGTNGRRVQGFLSQLDKAVRQKVLAISRETPLVDPEDAVEEQDQTSE